MIGDFRLVAIIRNGNKTVLQRIPISQSSQGVFVDSWISEYEHMVHESEQINFKAGYKLGKNQCFRLLDFDLPLWMDELTSHSVESIKEIESNLETLNSVQGTVAFSRGAHDEATMLFQDFSRSMVVYPGDFLQLKGDNYMVTGNPGILLDRKLCAVYLSDERKLLFYNIRAVNSFLPVFESYKRQTEREIKEFLSHKLLATQEIDKWSREASLWFLTQFTRLKDSGILDRYTAEEIESRARGYDVKIQIVRNKIVFPSDYDSAKKLLQLLNEDCFKGAITDTVYTTNSKRLQVV